MRISDNGINCIKQFEGFSSNVYICSAGKRTIGYGHVLLENEKYERISEEEAEQMLRIDLLKAENAVARNVVVLLAQCQFDAIVSLVFNIGAAAFQRSTLRHKINVDAEDEEIAREFTRWIYAGGRVLPGLIKRRAAEAKMYIYGA
jgi:lysozyme